MERDRKPPVNEVVLSVSFEDQESLRGAKAPVTLQALFNEFPEVLEQPTYEMPTEHENPFTGIQNFGSRIRFTPEGSMPERRYWFTKPEDRATLIQVQSSYFAVNWRRHDDSIKYPGFETLQETFRVRLDQLKDAVVKQNGKPLNIRQIEVSYINILRPDNSWADFTELENVLTVKVPCGSKVEQFGLTYSYPLRDGAQNFIGRLHATVNTGFGTPDDIFNKPNGPDELPQLTPVIQISNTVRTKLLGGPHDNPKLDYVGIAHEHAVKAFRDVVTERALTEWGIA